MISEALRVGRVAAVALIATALIGCGNYSNDELEFMNALPTREELSAQLVDSSTPDDEAELAKQTHSATRTFNTLLKNVLGMVDLIRSFSPSSRTKNSRTWGPIPAEQPGFQWRFVMTRESSQPATFGYRLELQRVGDPPDAWIPWVTGGFIASSGAARRGEGWFNVETDKLRAADFPFEKPDDQKLKSLSVSYSTKAFPISVTVDLTTNPSLSDTTVTNTLHYEYGAQADGQGAMRFEVTADWVPATPAFETLIVTARWLPHGEGRAEATIKLGDGAGLTQTQCWDSSFRLTYNHEPWATVHNRGDILDCPVIPEL